MSKIFNDLSRLRTPDSLARQIVGLATPIIMASLSQTLMSLIDIAMVGRIGAAAVAAVGLGGMLIYAVSSFLNAIQSGVQTVVARRVGQKRQAEVIRTVRVTLLFSLVFGSLFGGLIGLANKYIFPAINSDPLVIQAGIAYMTLRAPSIGLVMAGYVFYAFYNGISRSRIHMVVALIANTANVLFNYALIFGKWGWPEMGTAGAGLATTLSSALAVILYAFFYSWPTVHRIYFGLWWGRLDMADLRQVLRISMPAAFQNFGVIIGFALFMVIMGMVSTVSLAATEIVFNILSFSFMPAMGFLYATQTLVSENIGSGDYERAARSVRLATRLCMLFMGAMGVAFLAAPQGILRIFTNDQAIIVTGTIPLQILGLVQFFDAIGMVHLGALRGAADNFFPAIADILLMWLFFLPVSYVTAVYSDWGILGGWIALAFYISFFALAASQRFKHGTWRTITV
jgi:putative MATE family efflux protein